MFENNHDPYYSQDDRDKDELTVNWLMAVAALAIVVVGIGYAILG